MGTAEGSPLGAIVGEKVGLLVSGVKTALHTVQPTSALSPTTKVYTYKTVAQNSMFVRHTMDNIHTQDKKKL